MVNKKTQLQENKNYVYATQRCHKQKLSYLVGKHNRQKYWFKFPTGLTENKVSKMVRWSRGKH